MDLYRKLEEAVAEDGEGAVMESRFPGLSGDVKDIERQVFPASQGKAPWDAVFKKEKGGYVLTEPFGASPRLVILGAGHVSRALCPLAGQAGFSVTVIDDRKEYADPEFFPGAKVISAPFAEGIRSTGPKESDYFVIVTRGHQQDETCIRELFAHKESVYVGLMGSRKRTQGLFSLLERSGLDGERLGRIHTPIGLPIGAKTVPEIAVSIAAELIQTRREGGYGKGEGFCDLADHDAGVLRYLSGFQGRGCLVSVLETSGSVPRGAGARMVLTDDGQVGSVGGGCAEAMASQIGKNLIGSGKYEIIDLDMSGKKGVQSGILCGGTMRLLLEDISGNG